MKTTCSEAEPWDDGEPREDTWCARLREVLVRSDFKQRTAPAPAARSSATPQRVPVQARLSDIGSAVFSDALIMALAVVRSGLAPRSLRNQPERAARGLSEYEYTAQ